jgi:hypothetical protein
MNKDQVGQGLAEYAMGISLIAIIAVLALVLLGPAVGELLETVRNQLGTAGIITGVIAERTGYGEGNTVHVTVGVTRPTTVLVRDEASSESAEPVVCRGSCLIILAGVGPEAGTVSITTETGHTITAEYAARP